MYKEIVTYTDLNGTERSEDVYFNLTETELIKWQASVEGGLLDHLKKIVRSNNQTEIMKLFDEIILKAYGEKSADGRFFRKSPEITEAFSQSVVYDILFKRYVTDSEAGSKFINSIIPADLANRIDPNAAAAILAE